MEPLKQFKRYNMQRNVRLYPWFQAFASLHFWLPVFFLYFLSALSLREVLILETIYYWSVVALEVPSGYFSDRLGRKPTLLIASAAWIVGYLTFALTSSFGWFVFAQICLAIGMSFRSGTDSSFLFDSLQAEKRSEEVGRHESIGSSYGFFATAFAALAGGLLAGFDLRIAYLLSAVGGVFAFLTVCRMTEPPKVAEAAETTFIFHFVYCLKLLRGRILLWITLFVVAMTVFNHVPYEFFQSYFDLLVNKYGRVNVGGYEITTAATSIHVALTMLIAGWSSRYATGLAKRLGVTWALLSAMLLQGILILAMGVILHPIVGVLLLLRSTPRALMAPIVNATVHPIVNSEVRATLLSMQSFAGRLCFGAALLVTSFFVSSTGSLTEASLSQITIVYAAIVSVALACLAAFCFALPGTLSQPAQSPKSP